MSTKAIQPKKMTLEKLAKMVAGGFNDVSERFDKVDVRLDKVEGRLNGVENMLDRVEGRLGDVEGKLVKVEGRVDKVECGLNAVKTGMVTKDYLDEKLLALKGDLTIMTRKEDVKLRLAYLWN